MAELKPTEQEISMIASAYCRLQFGIKNVASALLLIARVIGCVKKSHLLLLWLSP